MSIIFIASIGISFLLFAYLLWLYFASKQWLKLFIATLIAVAYVTALLLFVAPLFRLILSVLCIITVCNYVYRENRELSEQTEKHN